MVTKHFDFFFVFNFFRICFVFSFHCFHLFFHIPTRFSIMRVEINRLVSFQRCRNIEVSRIISVETGFYYLGPGDRVECYFCNIGIMNWSAGDDEVVEHIRYSSGCPLLTKIRIMLQSMKVRFCHFILL